MLTMIDAWTMFQQARDPKLPPLPELTRFGLDRVGYFVVKGAALREVPELVAERLNRDMWSFRGEVTAHSVVMYEEANLKPEECLYRFTIRHEDGRFWSATVPVGSDGHREPRYSVTSPDPWSARETAAIFRVCAKLLDMVADYRMVFFEAQLFLRASRASRVAAARAALGAAGATGALSP